jgi:hypothetical protein
MGLHLSRRGYSVRVEDMARRDSSFVIRAEIAYAAHLSEDERMRLTPLAELDLLLGVEGAQLRGRHLGPDLDSDPVQPRAKMSRRAGLIGRGGRPGLAVSPLEEA